MPTKTCKACGTTKDVLEFCKNKAARDGLTWACKTCLRERGRQWWDKNKDKVKKRKANDYAENPQKFRELSRISARKWIAKNREYVSSKSKAYYKANTEHLAKTSRARKYLKKYGITQDQKDLMAREQGGCAICGSSFKNKRDEHLDHNHSTITIRKILCSKCNCGIGMFNENIGIMTMAIKYLEEFDNANKNLEESRKIV